MNSVNSLVEYQIDNSYILGVIVVSVILCLCLLYNMIKFDTNAFKKSLSRKFKKAIDTFIYEKETVCCFSNDDADDHNRLYSYRIC